MMKKRMTSLVLALVMCLSLSVQAWASQSNMAIPGGIIPATQAEIDAAAQVEKPMPPFESLFTPKSTWTDLCLTYYGQELSTSCGPACIKMALKHITTIEYKEATIRNTVGCNEEHGISLSVAVEYLNDHQTQNRYVAKYTQNKTTLANNLYSGIVAFNAPPLVVVKESPSNGFPYSSASNGAGHMILISATNDTKTSFDVVDPWAGYVNEPQNQVYSISISDLYSAHYASGLIGEYAY